MDKKRTRRIETELQREIASILAGDLKDPRVSSLASVTAVDLSNDLQSAKVYVSTLGDEEEKEELMEGLEHSKGFIKLELGNRLELRHIPDISFVLDESIERGIYMDKLIEDVIRQDEENRKRHEL